MSKVSIIIVDDDSDDREILRDAFVAADDTVEYHLVPNGEELLRGLDKRQKANFPALIMLDLNMPGKDGRETLKELKAHKTLGAIPVIVFTTSSSYQDKQMAYDAGANCFVTKPDTFNKLVELTRSIIRLWVTEM